MDDTGVNLCERCYCSLAKKDFGRLTTWLARVEDGIIEGIGVAKVFYLGYCIVGVKCRVFIIFILTL